MKQLPEEFIEMLSKLPGHEDVARAMSETQSPVAVRVNRRKGCQPSFPLGCDSVPWEPDGFYLPERRQFTFMPELYAGRFYVQDASSMIVAEAVRRVSARLKAPFNVLDACAAPGGKTIGALAALSDGTFVLANEYEPERCAALIENLQRWGETNVAVSRGDAAGLARVGQIFDVVIADVPCSGEGMMRKSDAAVGQWSRRLIDDCAALQRRIVEGVWQTLRPGGYLIYSTCTFNTVENEENVLRLCNELGAEPVDLQLDSFPGVAGGVVAGLPCARCLPGKVRGEGQFVAVVRKPLDAESKLVSMPRRVPTVELPFADCLDGEYAGFKGKDGDVYAVERRFVPLIGYLSSKINLVMPGLLAASPKGKDFMPAHPLGACRHLAAGSFPVLPVGYEKAIDFLRGEVLIIPDDVETPSVEEVVELPKGFMLVCHDGLPLGFAKNIGRRANNLVPSGRRIRSALSR